MRKINFFNEDTDFKPKQKGKIREWVKTTAKAEGRSTGDVNFVFCSDPYLLTINKQYLNHHTLTDIITFDNTEQKHVLSGDVFISIDRVRENANSYSVSERDELHRVIIHGILHLCGYRDKTAEDQELMREKEDFYLARREF